jgi:hypothetical protein
MSTPVTPPTQAAAAPVSLLKKVGKVLGKVAQVFVKDAAPAEPLLAKALEAMFPAFAPQIAVGDALFTKIVQQILVTETAANTIANAPSGAAKLQAVVNATGSEIDAWVKNLFPGAAALSAAQKAGLVQAVFSIVDGQAPAAAN